MKDLLFVTDRFPYDNSEAFIENEIKILCENFDRVFILPTALSVDTSMIRKVPDNVIIVPPAKQKSAKEYKNSFFEKSSYISTLGLWNLLALSRPIFYKELWNIIRKKRFSFGAILKIMMSIGSALRNMYHYRKKLRSYQLKDVDMYSYWLIPDIIYVDKYIDGKIRRKIARTHRFELYEEESRYNYLPLQRRIIEAVDKVVCISQDGKEYLTKKYPMYKDKYELSYLGTLDYGLCNHSDNDAFVIMSCSYVVPVKRVELILDSLIYLEQTYSKELPLNIKWVHFGGGPLLEEIKEKATHNLDRIQIEWRGQVTNSEVLSFYKIHNVDVFVNVSTSEGLPVSIMEATSFGLPVVATNVGGTGEIVFDSKNGYLLDKTSSKEDIAQIIAMLMENRTSVRNMGDCSREIWEKRFNALNNYAFFVKKFLS